MSDFTFERLHRMGIPDSSQHTIYENGTPRFTCYSAADALYLTNLLNLTTREQRDQALAGMYRSAAE